MEKYQSRNPTFFWWSLELKLTSTLTAPSVHSRDWRPQRPRASTLQTACTKYVTIQSGDTCASLAASAGIDVADFLRDNPSIRQSGSLDVGSTHCVDPGVSLQISPDGQCGGNFTCSGSLYGQCCSEHGWCGSTDDYCGAGCDPTYGVCTGPVSSPSSTTIQASTSHPMPVTCPGPGTEIATVLTTETVQKTLTETDLLKTTSTVLETSIATSTSIITSTDTVQRTIFLRTTSTILETRTITISQVHTPPPDLRTVTVTVTVISVRTNPVPLPTTVTATTTVAAPVWTMTKTLTYPCPVAATEQRRQTTTRTVTLARDKDWAEKQNENQDLDED
ncbi:hypothetical protein C8A03DRAFT_47784 [Achaetomium macrosporum]|uniref:Chitin-binding type-1 domain-containing protein n=1 Tax=Achaetomium macrosporum TaxID=79813 RepID=A0AAN7C1Q8_9PEZI|nr:hypothetical protein C8A03DRAFT_47784 [Achaetomium macrosporum]